MDARHDQRSVRRISHHPTYLNDPEIIQAGFDKYRKDCAMCHGTPVSYPGEVGKGLNPEWGFPGNLFTARCLSKIVRSMIALGHPEVSG